jgi:hypothetical protein
MMLNVNQRFAGANQEKISVNTLYCTKEFNEGTRNQQSMTHKGLDVEKEHANEAMLGLVQSREVDESILRYQMSDRV